MNQETEQEKKEMASEVEFYEFECLVESQDFDHSEEFVLKDDFDRLRAENEKLIAERSQIDVSYRELVELRKENERLGVEKTAGQILWQGEIDKLKAENEKFKAEIINLKEALPLKADIRHWIKVEKENKKLKAENERLKDEYSELVCVSLDQEEKEERLKDLVARAKPWLKWYMDQLDEDEELTESERLINEWLADFKKEIGG